MKTWMKSKYTHRLLSAGITLVFLAAFRCLPAHAATRTLGLTTTQILRMTPDAWLKYYHHQTGTQGARSTYKALVIYTNLLEESNEHNLKGRTHTIGERFRRLEMLLQQLSEQQMERSGGGHGSGNAVASHQLGERYARADLLRHLLAESIHPHAVSQGESLKLQKQAAQWILRVSPSDVEIDEAAQTRRQIVGLIAHWPVRERLLALDYLRSHLTRDNTLVLRSDSNHAQSRCQIGT